MRLSQQYQPVTLDDVVGQPAIVRKLKRLVAEPRPAVFCSRGKGAWARAPRPRP